MKKLYAIYEDIGIWHNRIVGNSYCSIQMDLPDICTELDIEFCPLSYNDFYTSKLPTDNANDIIVLLEVSLVAPMPPINYDLKNIRIYFPNATLICIGWDSLYYYYNVADKKSLVLTGFEVNGVAVVDLWLDGSQEIIDFYTKLGINSELLIPSPTEAIINEFNNYRIRHNKDNVERDIDILNLCWSNTKYRQEFHQKLSEYGLKIYPNRQTDILTIEAEFNYRLLMYGQYNSAKICLGDSSSAVGLNHNIRCLKGFKHLIAPFANCLLIHDDFPLFTDRCPISFPIYQFGNTFDVVEIYNRFFKQPEDFTYTIKPKDYIENIRLERCLEQQRNWISTISFKKQFIHLLKKYNIV